jgi:putative oxidoreductase
VAPRPKPQAKPVGQPADQFFSAFQFSGFPLLKGSMKYLIHICRILLGLMFAVLGSNAFFHFLAMPPLQGDAAAFMGALIHSGYLYPIAALQVVGGICLLTGRLAPLGLTLLGPIIVNIDLYHIFIDRSGLMIGAIVSIMALFLLWVYRFKFPSIFRP